MADPTRGTTAKPEEADPSVGSGVSHVDPDDVSARRWEDQPQRQKIVLDDILRGKPSPAGSHCKKVCRCEPKVRLVHRGEYPDPYRPPGGGIWEVNPRPWSPSWPLASPASPMASPSSVRGWIEGTVPLARGTMPQPAETGSTVGAAVQGASAGTSPFAAPRGRAQ